MFAVYNFKWIILHILFHNLDYDYGIHNDRLSYDVRSGGLTNMTASPRTNNISMDRFDVCTASEREKGKPTENKWKEVLLDFYAAR